jgi:hypothetical protein
MQLNLYKTTTYATTTTSGWHYNSFSIQPRNSILVRENLTQEEISFLEECQIVPKRIFSIEDLIELKKQMGLEQ